MGPHTFDLLPEETGGPVCSCIQCEANRIERLKTEGPDAYEDFEFDVVISVPVSSKGHYTQGTPDADEMQRLLYQGLRCVNSEDGVYVREAQ